jgi:hypothetical protein
MSDRPHPVIAAATPPGPVARRSAQARPGIHAAAMCGAPPSHVPGVACGPAAARPFCKRRNALSLGTDRP